MLTTIKDLAAKSLFFLNDDHFCRLAYVLKHKRLPNLRNPSSFNEKLLYLKLSERNLEYKKLVDKYEVREYVAKRIGAEYLNKIYGVYESQDDIEFNSLPNKFVLKVTSSSKMNVICKDKRSLDLSNVRNKVKKWLDSDFYMRTREWQYKDIKPRLIVEEYLEDKSGQLYDYKFFCFNGSPKFIQVDINRFKDHRRNMYDLNWGRLPFEYAHKSSHMDVDRPPNFEKMLELSKKLSEGFKFVRVDLYNIDGRIYFGEITFHPENCNGWIHPRKYDRVVGGFLSL